MANKLELVWLDKEKEINPEPRLLIENPQLSHLKESNSLFSDSYSDNLLIHGDNLVALKSLQHLYAGKIKCVYIDPPYNTGAAFEHYDDNVEHSVWLSLMSERLKLLKKLLKENGVIFIQIDYNEQAYLKVLCDEIFGRQNFLTMITCKVKAPSGIASGANAFFDCSEYILAYAKNKQEFDFHSIKVDSSVIGPKAPTVTSVYNQLINKWDDSKFVDFASYEDVVIKELPFEGFDFSTIPSADRTEETYYKNYSRIFRLAAISGGRDKKVFQYLQSIPNYDRNKVYSYSYIASQGRNKGKLITNYIWRGGGVLFLKDFVRVDDEKRQVYKQDIITNIFYNDWWQGLTNEGGVNFKNGQKPEKLIATLLKVVTDEGDYVLDSFLGSGTTCAAAHKMRRRWIGIEMGEHAYTHCKKRLDSIIDGNDSTGITKQENWESGGGYKFYELAPTLINEDAFGQAVINKEYNSDMLAAAVAIHEGFKYEPDLSCYWKQSKNDNNTYLYVTTKHVNEELINSIKAELKEDEYLVIVCKSYDETLKRASKNITIKKIPQSLLKNCEFGVDNYNLNIVCPPEYEYEEDDE